MTVQFQSDNPNLINNEKQIKQGRPTSRYKIREYVFRHSELISCILFSAKFNRQCKCHPIIYQQCDDYDAKKELYGQYKNKTQRNILQMNEKPNNEKQEYKNDKLTYRWPGLLQSDDAALLESSSSSLDVITEAVRVSPGDRVASDGLSPVQAVGACCAPPALLVTPVPLTIDVVARAFEASCASAGSIWHKGRSGDRKKWNVNEDLF